MAKADHIKKLVASFGRNQEFRAAALRIIDEAANQGKKPFAESLRKILDANVRPDYQAGPQPGLTTLASQIDAAADLVDEITVSRGLNDIVLNPDTRLLVEGLIEERRRSEELRRHRLPISTRLLFSGPPGCGKTFCAEVLARELSLPLYAARIDVIISSFLGETASNLRRLFEFALRGPCVLFLDEFDALARTRTDSTEHNELRRVVNSLLLMIERFKGPGLVIAATPTCRSPWTKPSGGASTTYCHLTLPANVRLHSCSRANLRIFRRISISMHPSINWSACHMRTSNAFASMPSRRPS
jgi:SpoVK/Ycf46/Vps4 family AAA+-type ATPase